MDDDPTAVRATAESALADRLAACAATLDAAAGSSSLCSLSRAGVPMPGVKYPEGGWAALREVDRLARSGMSVPLACSETRARWAEDLAARSERGSGPDWISYLTGGLDALDGLADDLHR